MKIILPCFIILIHISLRAQQVQSIGTSADNEYCYAVCADNQQNTFMGGSVNDNAWLFKRNPNGDILWSQLLNLTSSFDSDISYLEVLGDTLYGCGMIRNGVLAQGGVYFKLNAQTGSVYWIKKEESSKQYFSSMSYENGKFYLTGAQVNGTNGYSAKVWCVSSSTGNTIWETPALGLTFPSYNIDYVDDILGASEMVNGKMYLTGRSYVNGATNLNMRPLLIGIDNTGNIFLTKYLLFNTATSSTNRFYGMDVEFDGDSLVVAYFGDDNCSSCADFKTGLLKTDLNGNVSWAKYYDVQGVSIELVRGLNVTNDGYVLYGYGNHTLANGKMIVYKVNKAGVFQTGRLISASGSGNVSTLGSNLNLAGKSSYKNGIHYFGASTYTNSASRDIVFVALDDQLNAPSGCYPVTPTNVTTTSFAPFSANLNLLSFTNTVSFQSITQTNNFTLLSVCDGIDVTFTQNATCSTSEITATVTGLTAPLINWSNGASGNTVTVNVTDTLFVTVTSTSNCCIVTDTVVPSISTGNIQVILPADSSYCLDQGSSFQLFPVVQNASGAVNYLWSNGATTNSIPVAGTGIYWLQATDDCGSSSDTIEITVGFFPVVGNDTVIEVCTGNFPVDLQPEILNAGSIVWNDGVSTQDRSVNSSGIYTIFVSNSC